MTDPGLTNRLRQHSRRAGLNVGISMALAVAICVAGFAGIYAWLTPLASDFIPQEDRSIDAPTRNDQEAGAASVQPSPTPERATATEPTPNSTAVPTSGAPPTPDASAFTPTHQSTSQFSVNFRAEPSRDAGVVVVLTPATPLQYLNQDAPTSNPAEDGNRWMRFRTDDGQEGWIREVDAEPYQEDA